MARLPQPGGDSGNWGSILNDYLSQAHKSDGTLKDNTVTTSTLAPNSVSAAAIADGSVTKQKLSTAVQSSLDKADTATQPADLNTKYTKPADGIPLSDLQQSDLNVAYAPLQPQAVTIPSGLGWDQTKYPLSMTITDLPGMTRAHGVSTLTPESAFDSASTARTAPGATFYVDGLNGLDTNVGTQAAPFQRIWKAVQAANAANVPSKVIVKATVSRYIRSNNPSFGAVYPTVDIAFVASGGRINTGTFDDFTASVDSTYTRSYITTVSANTVNRVVDLIYTNQYGNYSELVNVSGADLCNNTPGSWYHHTDGTLYIHRYDGAAVTQFNTRFYRSSATSFSLRTGVNLYIGGESGNDGFDVEGGHSYGGLEVTPTSASPTEKVIAVSNCTFKYAGGKIDNSVGRGVSIDNWHGAVVLSNVRADAALTDGFNFHNSIGAPRTLALTINCSATDNGRPGMQSCNSHTLHENVIAIDLCSTFNVSRGGSIRNINTSKAFYAGTYIKDDRGDVGLGGGGIVKPTAVRADDSATIWCDRTRTDMPAGGYEYFTGSGTSTIHKRATWPVHSPDSGPGTINVY